MKSLSLTTRLFTLLLAIGLFTACDPQLQEVFKASLTPQAKNAIDVLPANASMVAMLNTQDLKSNEYTNVFGSNSLLNNAPDEGLARLQDFIEATGFDPDKDLTSIYFAASEIVGSEPETVNFVAYGTMDAEQLKAYVLEQVGNELETSTYRGADVFEIPEDDAPAFSFVNDDMMIAANSVSSLKAMIDRLEDGGNSLADNAVMMDKINQAAAGQSGWFVAKKPSMENTSYGRPSNDIEETAQQIWTAVDYFVGALNIESDGLDGQVFVYPNDGVSADDLSSLMNGMIAAAKASPELSDEDLDMLDDIRAEASGDHVRVGMYVENSLIQKVRTR